MKTSPGLSLAALAGICLAGVCQGQQGAPSSPGARALLLPPPPHSNAAEALIQPRSLSTVLQQVPSCARPCVENATAATRDSCADGTCLCADSSTENTLSACVAAACTLAEGIATKNYTQAACDVPRRDRATPFDVASITLCAVTGVMVLARLLFKGCYSYARRLGLDDWFIIASVAVGLPCTIINTVGLTRHGLGKDVWTLPPATMETFGRYFYAQQILYLFLVTSIKMSLLFFYLSIFPGRGVRAVLWLTMAVTAVFGLTFMLLSVFQCTPVRFYWLRYVQPLDGHCTRINLLGWIHGGVSVAIDVWMIGIPLFQIRKLELHWKKKVGAAIMFLTGTFVTIVSALRLRSLIYFANSINPTWDEVPVALWATIEINVGLMCACLPTLRLILVRMWPRVFGSTINSLSQRSAVSHRTSTSAYARKVKVRPPSVDTDTAPISPRLVETDTAFELDAKYPTWEDREQPGHLEDSDNPEHDSTASFENECHAK
ncbi:Extracellular membrane CFEM domain [Cordyceps militaris]|uniref:Extracellular membrane CFEM domain n=1 Tax=Cordyceps militaris TaxID=73501 RepID=A0A2H4S717_CORMI|nr:Extracellular membrane CFEM domain [Cordyceps militaris]